MFWKVLKMMLKRFGPDKWCRNHKMKGFPPKKNNEWFKSTYGIWLFSHTNKSLFFKILFSTCEKDYFLMLFKILWREIYILSLLCVQKCILDSTWTYNAYEEGIVFWIIIIKLEIFFLLKCHQSQSACLPQTGCFTQLKCISHGSGSLRPRGQQDSVSGQSFLIGLQTATLCPHMFFPQCVHMWRGSSNHIDQRPTIMVLFNLN